MAASDQDGSQSDSKNDDSHTRETSKQFSTIHQVSSGSWASRDVYNGPRETPQEELRE